MLRLASGEMVLALATTVPGRAPAAMPLAPRTTSRDMAVSPTHRKTHSANSPTWVGVSQ